MLVCGWNFSEPARFSSPNVDAILSEKLCIRRLRVGVASKESGELPNQENSSNLQPVSTRVIGIEDTLLVSIFRILPPASLGGLCAGF